MRIIGIAVVLALAPMAFGQLVDMTIDSSTAGAHENIDQYLTDDILNIEVAQKDGWMDWLYWNVPTFNFGPINLAGVSGEVQLYDRYHQEDYPERPAYSDCNVWLLLEDVNGELADIGWSAEHWTADYWRWEVRDLTGFAWPDVFDETQVTKLWVRSTNWGAPEPPNNDFLRFSQLIITPEPGSLALLLAGGLALLRRR